MWSVRDGWDDDTTFGPAKITFGDLWTLIPPGDQTLRDERKLQEGIPDYIPDWLTSTL